MRDATPKTIYLRDYTPPPYTIDSVDLHVDLGEELTRVRARLEVRRQPGGGAVPLVLDGRALVLRSVAVDGRVLAAEEFQVDEESLTLPEVPQSCTVETVVELRPQENTSLEGLYKSSGNFCTQCEAQGFRKITFYLDRPDVMARFATTIVAERERYPVLLSNGNRVTTGELEGGRHWARWEDPFRKPCYLFALVAGRLSCVSDRYTTSTGRTVALEIYVEPQNADKCEHALRSLAKAMRWDEDVYGREYDLDVFMIVAVDDFNMGAMENKGLNIFNSKYVLARPDTATDEDYEHIEGVIAHEYFHNWSGNRVTCRDWFQLSLKEGFTVFRDQQFTADQTSRAVKRIKDVTALRTYQFREDGGPLAHPVRPDSYVEINNFYTLTVYEKGAEVVRMVHTLLGAEAFRRGSDLYFKRHDGQAVTTDDFIKAMEDANQVDLTQFKLWYSQAGTPAVEVRGEHDAAAGRYVLHLRQSCPPTPGQAEKQPMHIPLAVGLLGRDGRDLALRLEGEGSGSVARTRVLELRQAEQSFCFVDVTEPPVPSLLRGFSAPVRLRVDYDDADLAFLSANDSDELNRWDAGQQLATRILQGLVADQRAGRHLVLGSTLVEVFRATLGQEDLDPRLAAAALTLPSEIYLAELVKEVDPLAIHEARRFVRRTLAQALRVDLLRRYQDLQDTGPYRIDALAIGRRRLKNLVLGYFVELAGEEERALCMAQFGAAQNMTDVMAALGALSSIDCPEREQALASFYDRWAAEPLVVDKWFAIQATAQLPDTLRRVEALQHHPAFNIRNPNRARSLVGAFCQGNPAGFHAADGEGYRYLVGNVLTLNGLNPQVAARMVGPLSHWRRYEPVRRQLMREALERVLAEPSLSKDVYEIASKSLA